MKIFYIPKVNTEQIVKKHKNDNKFENIEYIIKNLLFKKNLYVKLHFGSYSPLMQTHSPCSQSFSGSWSPRQVEDKSQSGL